MKKINWKLGLFMSCVLSLIALSFRIVRMEQMRWDVITTVIINNFLYCLSCWIIHSLLLNSRKKLQFHNSTAAYSILSVIIVGLLIVLFEWLFSLFSIHTLEFAPDIYGTKRYIDMALRGLLLSSLYYFILYYAHLLQDQQRHNIEIAQLKQAQLEANLSSLKEQLSPHFLFNTLNTLSAITEEKAVKQYVAELANVYRYVLMYKKMDTATLGQELAFTESYLYIIKTRMQNAIIVDIKPDSLLQNSLFVPFALQLLIENAIKHNVASVSKPLIIDIYDEAGKFIVVTNKLQAKSSIQQHKGIGLNNIMQRYKLLFNENIVIEKTATTFMVKLPIIKR